MTVPEPYLSTADNLASHSRVFPASIRVPHHQLRNFISTVYDNKIYFVHHFDIFAIDIEEKEQFLVATVPFEARCLAAGHGWVCVGGETKGDCAFVRIGDDGKKVGNFGLDLVVDMLGKQIVNSMTVHRLPSCHAGIDDDAVVLISNNDTSVTLYSLTHREVLWVLPHRVPMNYATLSPDCSILAAVGDSNEVYFYQRKVQQNHGGSSIPTYGHTCHDWHILCVPKVPAAKGIHDDYSFAVTFSPEGHLCAVSAQGGVISVFDMNSLVKNSHQPEVAILCTFQSSRPSLWGCVRSMAFSPGPWDLLAWTEDHGRIGIADVRRAFTRRQCLHLDFDLSKRTELNSTNFDEYMNLDVKERLKRQHLQRMRALRGQPPVGARTMGDRQRQSLEEDTMDQEDEMDLNEGERSVLDALETTIDDVEHYSLRPYSINYASTPTVHQSASVNNNNNREYEVHLLNAHARLRTIPPTPQRRRSVILSESSSARNLPIPEVARPRLSASPAAISAELTPPMSTNDLSPSTRTTSQPLPYNIPPSDPWHIIERALATDHARERTTQANLREVSLVQIESAISAERQLAERLERQLSDERRLSSLLRTELQARERLLEARQQEFLDQSAESRLSPSFERVLHRQLRSEEENGRQRSSELEAERRNNNVRIEQYVNERDAILNGIPVSNTRRMEPTHDTNTNTTLSDRPSGLYSLVQGTSIDSRDLDSTLRRMEEERRSRHQRLADLEAQVRRAESRVELASLPDNLRRSEVQERTQDHRTESRYLPAARASLSNLGTLRAVINNSDTGSNSQSPTQDRSPTFFRNRGSIDGEQSEMSGTSPSTNGINSTIPRTSELAGRVSENDMRLARMMLHRNPNWLSGGIRRPVGATRIFGSFNGSPYAQSREALEEVIRDSGIGTAGLGWSPDGRKLYAGSEHGIFEFKIHIKDRMCSPAWGPDEMR